MAVPRRLAAVVVVAGVSLVLPAVGQAKTKEVYMGVPPAAQKRFQRVGPVDVNDYFPHIVTINAGDSVRFVPAGFHTMDLPPRPGGPLPLLSPTGQKVAGVLDAAGAPFWFNGQNQLAFTPDLLRSAFGKRFTYRGSSRVESGLPFGENLKPLTVKFPHPGSYRYYCDVHPGMTGVVKVRRKGARVPSGRQDARALRAQIARDLKRARSLRRTKAPLRTVYLGAAARGGVEYFAMFPRTITVPRGTTLRFEMSPQSYEAHTATFGPGDPMKERTSYLGTLAASFESPAPDPRAIYPSEQPVAPGSPSTMMSPTLHGNGFWNSGVLDRSPRTPLPDSGLLTFMAPGTYEFYCLIHPFMHGTVKVQ